MKGTILVLLLTGFLKVYAQNPKLVLPVGHTSNLSTAKLSPDQTKVVTSSMDGTAMVWTIDGHLLLTLKGHVGHVNFASFTPDGAFIVTAGSDGNVVKWNAITGEEVFRGYDMSSGAWDVAISSDAKSIAVAHYSNVVKIYDLQDATRTTLLDGHSGTIKQVKFDNTSQRLVTASEDGTAVLWKTDGEKLFTFNHKAEVMSVNFSPDSRLVITASKDSTVKIWNAQNGELIKSLSPDNDKMTSASFHPDGKTFLTSSYNLIKTWDLLTYRELTRTETSASFNWVKYSPDGKKLLVFSNGGSAVIYNSQTGKEMAEMQLDEHTGAINSATFIIVEDAEFSPDGKMIITAGADQTAKLWNIENGNLIASFESRVKPVVSYSIDPVINKAVTGHEDGSVKLWDLNTGRLERNFTGHHNWILTVAFSNDHKNIISGGRDGALNIWEIGSGKQIKTEDAHDNWIIAASYSSDDKKILTGSWDYKAVLRDNKGKQIFTFNHQDNVEQAVFSTSGKKILTCSDSTVYIWSAIDGKLIRKIKMPGRVHDPELSVDETRLLSLCEDDILRVHNANTGALIAKHEMSGMATAKFLKSGKEVIFYSQSFGIEHWNIGKDSITRTYTDAANITSFSLSKDEKKLVAISDAGLISVYEMANGELIREYDLQESSLRDAEMITNDKLIAILDYGIKLFQLSKDKPLFTAVPLDSAEFITQEGKGYFQSTPKAAGLLHYLTEDNRIINFEQLDVKYNRPDILLRSIGNNDTALIGSYYKAYIKRIKKLGVDTSSFGEGFAVPEASIVNAGGLVYEQRSGQVEIKFSAKDPLFNLERFNLLVNENPLFGMKGIAIKERNRKNFDTTLIIQLSEGKNVIHASVANQNGTESYRTPLTLFYTPSSPEKQKIYFIGIGIDKFSNGKNGLNYSVKDIRDLAIKLKEKYGSSISIDTLFNENVNIANVVALKKKMVATSINDKVILSYSGHGLLSKDFDYFLSTYDVDFANPENGGLPYDALESLLDGIPARQKLMLIDACHSGEVDKEEMQHYRQSMASSTNKGLKGGELENTDPTAKLGMKNSFELMQELFVNVGRSTGATIISAAAGTQLAQERGDLKNGVFTYSILEFMEQNPTATVTELKNYVNKRVPELTDVLQVPTTRTETKVVDWRVW